MTTLNFLIYSLACYRLALLFSDDTGPWKIFTKLRSFLKRGAKKNAALRASDIHRGIECIRCGSVWFAMLIAAFACWRDSLSYWLVVTGDVFLLCMAVSAAAILWGRMFDRPLKNV